VGYKIYVCNLFPKLMISTGLPCGPVHFEGAQFGTDDPAVQQIIESNAQFGTSIHFKDTEEEMARMGRALREERAAIRGKERKKLLQQMKEDEEADNREKEAEEKAAKERLKAEKRESDLAGDEKKDAKKDEKKEPAFDQSSFDKQAEKKK